MWITGWQNADTTVNIMNKAEAFWGDAVEEVGLWGTMTIGQV